MKRLICVALLSLAAACSGVPVQDCYPGARPECRGLTTG